MFADPISFLYEGVAKDHPRTSLENPSTFTYHDEADGVDQVLSIRQSSTKARFRREVRVTRTKIAVNPISLQNGVTSSSVYLVIDEPLAGFIDTDLNDMAASLLKFLGGATPTDSTNVLKVLTGEY